MRLALSLARRGLGNVHPNPAVGCVLVRPDLDGRVVGRGWTRPGGRPHAESEALRQAGDLARGTTAYVTLEPCSHTGKTPPCADALIEAGIVRAVIAIADPDERVSGQGIRRLLDAGVEAEVGLLADEASHVNRGYLTRRSANRPHVTLKLAMTIDGRIATRTGDSQWITSSRARQEGHALRARHDAILTGSGTVRADDPALTCRLPGLGHRSPLRVVMAGAEGIPADCELMRSADAVPVRVFGGNGNGRPTPAAVLAELADNGINAVLIEAGAGIAAAFLAADLVDEIVCYRAPKIIGGEALGAIGALGVDRLGDAKHFRLATQRKLDEDAVEYYVRS